MTARPPPPPPDPRPVWRGTGVVLRPPPPKDAPELTRLWGLDEAGVRMTRSIPWPYTLADALAWIDSRSSPDPGTLALVLAEGASDRVLGGCGWQPFRSGAALGWPEEAPPHAEIGYWVGIPHRRRGLARQMVAALKDLARQAGQTRPLMAEVVRTNQASLGVLAAEGVAVVGAGLHWNERRQSWADVLLLQGSLAVF